MSRYVIYPYKMGSQTGRDLAEALGGKRVYPDRAYRPRPDDRIINLGNSNYPNWVAPMLNDPDKVRLAANKIETFRALTEFNVPTLDWTVDPVVARQWDKVYCRTVLNGHSGEGIVIWNRISVPHIVELGEIAAMLERLGRDNEAHNLRETVEQEIIETSTPLPAAPLYTRAIANEGEYRVHVFKGEVIDYRKKSRREDEPVLPGQSDIRTLGNGWVFRQSNLRRLERVENLAIAAIDALDLDFGAVDIIKDENGDVFVVEVNTAVAMDETTLSNYVTAIRNHYES